MENRCFNANNRMLFNFKIQHFSLLAKTCSLIFLSFFLSFAVSAQVDPVEEPEDRPHKLTSIARHNPIDEFTDADALTFRVTFKVDVQNVDATDFEIDGTTTATITNAVVIYGARIYELTVSGGDLENFNGRVGLNISASHNIMYSDGKLIAAEEPARDEVYTLNNTVPGNISVITTIAGSITNNSALSGGEIIIEGESTVTNRGICWNTNANPDISNSITNDGSGGGIFLSSITGLESGTTYYYKAYATNSSGTVYGEEYSFTTPCIDPIAASTISGNTQLCYGGNTDLSVVGGTLNSATEWRWYSESCGETFVGVGRTINVSPLESTTYYVRAEGDCVNPSSCISITVTVQDYEEPVITCPNDVVTNNDSESCLAVVNGITPLSLNNNCGSPTIVYTLKGATTGNGLTDASGNSFNLGETTVQYTASDGNGNSASCSFMVTVNDIEIPVITCPSNVSVNSNGENCSVAVNGLAPISIDDNCESTTVSYSLFGATSGTGVNDVSGSTFNVGITTVEYIVLDGSGNTASCSFDVSVIGNDNENPSVTCPTDVAVNNDTGNCTALVGGIAPISVGDNCSVPTVNYTLSGATTGEGSYDASGTIFNIGETTVEYTAVDGNANSATCSFTVTVTDNEIPLVLCPADTSVSNNHGNCTAIVNGIAPDVVSDNCETPTVTYTLTGATTGSGNNDASGTYFNIGATTVVYTATDGNENSASCSFTVTVADNEAPVIESPSDLSVSSDDNKCSAIVNGIAPVSVTDNCGIATITYTLSGETKGSGVDDASGTVFNIGETIVTYTATDNYNNADSSSFIVKIEESVLPLVKTKDLTIELDSLGLVLLSADEVNDNSTDNCGIDTMYLDKMFFGCSNIGENVVTLSVVDKAGNVGTETATITVIDKIVPYFEEYDTLFVCAPEGETSTVVYFQEPVVYDNCNVTLTQIEGEPSGSVFNACENLIRYRATDPAGNTAEISFVVYVRVHTEKPTYAVSPDVPFCLNTKDSIEVKAYEKTPCSRAVAQWFYDKELTIPVRVSPTTSRAKAPTESTTWYVRAVGCNITDAIPFDIEVNPLPEIDAGKDVTIYEGTELQLNATYDKDYRYKWAAEDISNDTTAGGKIRNVLLRNTDIGNLWLSDVAIYNPVFTGKVIGKYKLGLIVTDENYCRNLDALTVTVVNLKVYSGFTPNNDGYNDFWMIENIELYPDNQVKVFDRKNVLVYEKRAYDNSWQGTFDTRTGQKLPAGTYFYILELSRGAKVYKGVVTILGD